jgi:hypothetical protein
LGDGHASRIEDTPSSGAPIQRHKRNKTSAAVIPLQGRAVQSVDRYGNTQTIHYHHTPPSKTERYTMGSSSSEDGSGGVSESPARGRQRYGQASATLVNPMGYDVADEADSFQGPAVDPSTGYNFSDEPQPLPSGAPTTYHQASGACVNPMGYDEVDPETVRSKVRSIFSSSSSHHSGQSRISEKGQKPFIQSTPPPWGPCLHVRARAFPLDQQWGPCLRVSISTQIRGLCFRSGSQPAFDT